MTIVTTGPRLFTHLEGEANLRSYKVFDLFCGTGGFSKGFENDGRFQVVFGIDLLKTAIQTFQLNHPQATAIAGDIKSFDPGMAAERTGIGPGEVDVIIGGPPCQGFSSIRPNRSSDDEDPRNMLFNDFMSYIAFFRPPTFVMENVVGLATFKNGRTVEMMQEGFKALGYETDWRILNAAHFGVPQKRERLIMIGGEPGVPVAFPTPSHFCVSDTIGYRDKTRMLVPDLFSMGEKPLEPSVTVMDAIGDLPPIKSGETATEYTVEAQTSFQAERRANSTSLTLHGSTAHTPKMLEIIKHSGPNISCIPPHLISSGFSSCYSRLAADEPAVTITVNFVHPASNRCIHPVLDRALTPREGARLQSFDDDFQFAGTRTQIVKQIGNAVPPLLGKAIGTTIAESLASGQMSQGADIAGREVVHA